MLAVGCLGLAMSACGHAGVAPSKTAESAYKSICSKFPPYEHKAVSGEAEAQYKEGKAAWERAAHPKTREEMWKSNEESLRAYQLFEKAAAAEHRDALYMVGALHVDGSVRNFIRMGREEGFEKGAQFLERSAALGNVDAMLMLFKMYRSDHFYRDGHGVAMDVQKAFEFREKAACLGHVDSMYSMGEYYYEKNDQAKGVAFFEMAAAAGDAMAQCDLGMHYMLAALTDGGSAQNNGGTPSQDKGYAENALKAVEYFKEAAKQGRSGQAQVALRIMCPEAEGKIVEKEKISERDLDQLAELAAEGCDRRSVVREKNLKQRMLESR